MAAEDHYHQRIAMATERLAQLQARGLLASQREAAKAKQEKRREDARRRKRAAEIVFAVGCHNLDDAELAGALLWIRQELKNAQTRELHRKVGEEFMRCDRAAPHFAS